MRLFGTRCVHVFLILSIILAGVTGCKRSSDSDGKTTIAVIPKSKANTFWNKMGAGARKAGQEHDVNIVWKGPQQETSYNVQYKIVENQITRGVDAIVLAAANAKGLDGVVQKADKRGIPVVTVDSDVTSDTPISFVATNNVKGGKKAADKLAELIDGSGKVGIIPFVQGTSTSIDREKGFKQQLKTYEDIEVVATMYSDNKKQQAYNKTQDMLTAYPDLDGLFGANLPSAVGAGKALQNMNKAGEVKLVGFDAGDQEIAMLKEGIIQALIVQDPYQMGYKGLDAAVRHLNGEQVQKRIDTGVTVVTEDNLNDPAVQKILNPQTYRNSESKKENETESK